MEMSKRQEYQLDEYLDEVSINIYLLEWDGSSKNEHLTFKQILELYSKLFACNCQKDNQKKPQSTAACMNVLTVFMHYWPAANALTSQVFMMLSRLFIESFQRMDHLLFYHLLEALQELLNLHALPVFDLVLDR
ncbi:uncharacterized protein [Coffea arabica]|uniref:Uncharacterized protein n=1 Tax=Coffea arabica TaxID=13443 RepID=A0ABM4W9X2_COFAR